MSLELFKKFMQEVSSGELKSSLTEAFEEIFEARNPHGDYRHWIKKLEEYKDDPDIYISFTEQPKIGINPMTKFNTPAGIYTYPIKEMWEQFNDSNFNTFADNRPYIQVLRADSSVKHIEDLDKYTEDELKYDMTILTKIYGEELVSAAYDDAKKYAEHKIPAGYMWYITMKFGGAIKGSDHDAKGWFKVLSKDLGYGYIADKSGLGIIHGAELRQCVFMQNEAYTQIDMIQNTRKKADYYSKHGEMAGPDHINFAIDQGYPVSPDDIINTGDIELMKKAIKHGSVNLNEIQLRAAIMTKNVEMVKLILSTNIKLSSIALRRAISTGVPEITIAVMEKMDPTQIYTSVFVKSGDPEVVKRGLELTADEGLHEIDIKAALETGNQEIIDMVKVLATPEQLKMFGNAVNESVNTLATKHGVDIELIKDQLDKGIQVEK